MIVDLHTLKIGDKVKLRDGTVQDVFFVVCTENDGNYEFIVDFTNATYSYQVNGTYADDSGVVQSIDIMEIIRKKEIDVKLSELFKVPDFDQPQVSNKTEAARFNTGKTPYGNLPLDLLDGAARVLSKGEIKYSRANYRKGYEDLMSPLHSLIRHVTALQPVIEQELYDKGGPLFDAESGEAHIHHVITSALILIQAMRKKGIDV
jgi:hypothetical protein